MNICNETFDMLLKKYNVESFKKMKTEDRRAFAKILQKKIEEKIFSKKRGKVPEEAA